MDYRKKKNELEKGNNNRPVRVTLNLKTLTKYMDAVGATDLEIEVYPSIDRTHPDDICPTLVWMLNHKDAGFWFSGADKTIVRIGRRKLGIWFEWDGFNHLDHLKRWCKITKVALKAYKKHKEDSR